MKIEVKQKIVHYNVYVADDGQEFDNENDCIHHEKIINGERKICPDCNGEGKICKEYWDEDYHNGAPYKVHCYPTCQTCRGKGYLEKKIKEIWE